MHWPEVTDWVLKPTNVAGRGVTPMALSRPTVALAPLLLAPLPQELEPIVAALNRLLQQVAQLLAREQRFLADAAHAEWHRPGNTHEKEIIMEIWGRRF